MSQETCVCGLVVPVEDGPTHAYVPAKAGCWRLLGLIQADEMTRFNYPQLAHRLVVDAYMASHPGDGEDRRDRQSVFVHLVGLCGSLEEDWAPSFSLSRLRGNVSKGSDFPVLKPRLSVSSLFVTSMFGASDLEDYESRARLWASSVWDSWSREHARIRQSLR